MSGAVARLTLGPSTTRDVHETAVGEFGVIAHHPSSFFLIMNYRDFHPGDKVYVYGDVKTLERVDRTHVATRGEYDHLELWAYSEDLRPITHSDKLILQDLGFAYKDDYYIYDTDGYVVYWKPINCIVEDREGSPHRKRCKTLGDVQQFFYQIAGFELPL